MTTLDLLKCAMASRCISSALIVSINVTPDGTLSVVSPLMRITSAPRLCAARAIAKPIFPDDPFERKRTGSIVSRVAPAVTSIVSPVRSFELKRSLCLFQDLFYGSEPASAFRAAGELSNVRADKGVAKAP